jgi:hypothetical protein
MNNTVRRAFFRGYITAARVRARVLLDAYGGSTSEEIDYLVELARTQSERGRWSGYRASVPKGHRSFYDFEEEAGRIQTYGMEMVPGLLQTEAYLRAQLDNNPRVLAGDVEDIVATRLERQRTVLHGDAPADVAFVLSESCLTRWYGSNAVMCEQMSHLASLSGRPNIQVQVLPNRATVGGGTTFGFTALRIPSPRAGDSPLELVYTENLHDADYVDDPETVSDYANLWGHLSTGAQTREESRRLILHYAQEYA